jgi:hypothetical protein
MTSGVATAARGEPMASLHGRLARLEAAGRPARCPAHALRMAVVGEAGEPAGAGERPPACPRCRRPADVFAIELATVPDREPPAP